jgi:hypothetical protein
LGYTAIKLQNFAVERIVLFTFLIILSASFKVCFLDSKQIKIFVFKFLIPHAIIWKEMLKSLKKENGV